MRLRNRLVQAPIFTQYATTWGGASRKQIEYHRARARGGVGLIILENTSIDWEVGRTVGNPVRLDHDRNRALSDPAPADAHRWSTSSAETLTRSFRPRSWAAP
jgi:2,4-dienoyl-CoA reductase (NADPH2)